MDGSLFIIADFVTTSWEVLIIFLTSASSTTYRIDVVPDKIPLTESKSLFLPTIDSGSARKILVPSINVADESLTESLNC